MLCERVATLKCEWVATLRCDKVATFMRILILLQFVSNHANLMKSREGYRHNAKSAELCVTKTAAMRANFTSRAHDVAVRRRLFDHPKKKSQAPVWRLRLGWPKNAASVLTIKRDTTRRLCRRAHLLISYVAGSGDALIRYG